MIKPVLASMAIFGILPVFGQVVLVPASFLPKAAPLMDQNPSLKLLPYENSADALGKIAGAEAYIGSPSREMMEKAEKLRWVHLFAAGIEKEVGLPGFADGRVQVTNLKIYQGPEIADHAFALLLGLTRNLAEYQAAQTGGEWRKSGERALPLVELRGRTMLVIGYGGIGIQVAERAKAFGMTVHAIDEKDLPLSVTLEKTGKPDELLEMLPDADVIVSCVPITPQTEKMLGAEAFSKMKKGAYFINVSRGKVADTDALVKALEDGTLAGAGLDVVDPEPLPKDHPLWKMKNVIITPHVAGVSDGRPGRSDELILTNINRFAKSLPLKNLADPVKGY